MRKLNVCSANNLYGIDNAVCLLLQPFLQVFRYGKHRCGAERVAGVDAERINIFDKADGNHVSFCVAYNLKLKLLPAEDGFLDQYLPYKTCLQTARTDRF